MIREYDHVRIKESGVEGIVIDICETQNGTVYTVEHDEAIDGYYQREFCFETELEVI